MNVLLSILLALQGIIPFPRPVAPVVSLPTLVFSSCYSLGASVPVTTSSFNSSGANFAFVSVNYYQPVAITSVSDNKGNGNATALTAYGAGGDTAIQEFYWTNPTVGSGHTVTVTPGGAAYISACVEYWSGMNTSSPFDAGTDSGSNANISTCSPGSITPSSGVKVILTSLSEGLQAVNLFTIDSSYTVDAQVAYAPGTAYGGGVAHLIQSPNGATTNPTWTSTSGHSVCATSAFKGA